MNSIATSPKEIHFDKGLTYASISLNFKNLAKKKFLYSNFDGYQLNSLTKILFCEINKSSKLMTLLSKFSDFLRTI
ncbi:MAG: hypothetical protein LBV42_01260 [Methanobrevibacter sp.]|jgi:signal transduction protein with GAF and PtsI domain|nr:hypothetical protein [Methanobrevibacter sp.]